MSEHTSKLIEHKKIADHQLAVRIRCCDDPTTDSWHTLSITKDTTTEEVNAWVADRQKHVEDGHAASAAVEAHLTALTNLNA